MWDRAPFMSRYLGVVLMGVGQSVRKLCVYLEYHKGTAVNKIAPLLVSRHFGPSL